MDVKELRIGNLANHSELGIVEIIAVGKDYIHCTYNGETFYESVGRFSPIPITFEWLLKLGFIEGGLSLMRSVKNDVWLEWDRNTIAITYFSKEILIETIKYIHQLQNLHFVLTGEELQIKKDG
ncbi:hypothetical protein [Chryseobacterium daeguense]|uniref:hypothetical protein n=1 Tax=Chryseobacterium daeguense TaxID=412438 RepID=UPI0004242093|nr:hypothetical protein [Chryseobacterium daeguense]